MLDQWTARARQTAKSVVVRPGTHRGHLLGAELELDGRDRAFAMHAVAQVEQGLVEPGRGRHTLWTGDPGTALYVESCLSATAAFPTIDRF